MYRWFLLFMLVTSFGAETPEACTDGISPDAPLFKGADVPVEVRTVRQHCRGRRFPDFTSRDGGEFRDVTALAADERGMMVRYHLGTRRIPYEQLPGELQMEFIGRAFPKMSPEVERRQIIDREQRRVTKLEEHAALLKTLQEGQAGILEKKTKELEASFARDHGKIAGDLDRLEAERRKLETDLTTFNQPEEVAARRAEMEKQRVARDAAGRPVVHTADSAKFDESRKKSLDDSLRKTTRKIDLKMKSSAALGEQTEKSRMWLVKANEELSGPESSSAKQNQNVDKLLTAARGNLARLAEESARQGDDPAAFDRYCDENRYPGR